MHGITSYEQVISTQGIEGIKIKVPHLTLHSNNDPMVGTYNLLQKEIEQCSHVIMVSTYTGGHVAWFTGKEWRWFMQPTKECFWT